MLNYWQKYLPEWLVALDNKIVVKLTKQISLIFNMLLLIMFDNAFYSMIN